LGAAVFVGEVATDPVLHSSKEVCPARLRAVLDEPERGVADLVEEAGIDPVVPRVRDVRDDRVVPG
jgi:hypothetical protein